MTNLALTGILSFVGGCILLVVLMTIDEKKTAANALVLILAFAALLYGVVCMCQNVSNDTDGNIEKIELYHEQPSLDEQQYHGIDNACPCQGQCECQRKK